MIIPLLVALAIAAVEPIKVAPADPTAQFKGDNGALKFDPTCRDYTLIDVATNPSCAARVEKAEPAPALAIAARTLAGSPERAGDAVRLLERAAAASGHPAVHYLLGSVLGSAERIRPDYAKAVKHLSFAAERGNPAAADLLATLLIAGKGAPRDVPRAIRLYETAAANGFPSAAVSLGKLYLAGRHVPKNEALGRKWLEAAAAVGVPTAAQLAALAANDAKVRNFQLIPAPEQAAVKAVQYGTFDNPDIPPSFGFDLAFQKVHYAPYDDAVTLTRLQSGASTLPTPYLYELARRLASRNPEQAMRTYLVARTRMTYDSSRCEDPAAAEAMRAWDMLVAGDIRFLFTAGRPSSVIVDAALAEEAKLPANTQPWWVCRSGMSAMTAAIDGKPGPLKLKATSEWQSLRDAARAATASLAGPR